MLRSALRLGIGTATLLGGGWVLSALRGAPAALGAGPLAVRAVAAGSPNYRDGAFVNIDPASMFEVNREEQRILLREMLHGRSGRPPGEIPLAQPEGLGMPAAPLAVTWFGHATALVEVDGYRILTDPVWSNRCSPSHTIGPQRLHPPPIPLEALPAVDVVVISHDHYDHLDLDTVLALARSQRASFFVPLGVGAHLREWGIPSARIVELDWEQSASVDELTLTCTPARHFSGRFVSRNTTLWASWVFAGPHHSAYFGGDTGYTTSFADIGSQHGPFDLTLMPVGAYNKMWPDIHMNPEEAVRAHLDLNGAAKGLLVPIHWCTFRLAPHPWAEPVERLLEAAVGSDVAVAVPKPGQRIEADALSAPRARGSSAHDVWWR
ncbi:MAG TPA: MBL fold metallo-hydrolase [Mycobacterium sp.]|jgi:L-ascorbate metabolism protein UlaG (beta-lactamase superfamily)